MKSKSRIFSIDMVRGSAVFLSLVATNHGSYNAPHFFYHAEWHGLPIVDVMLPLFIMAMCTVLPIIYEKEFYTNSTHFFLRVLRRTSLLFILGLLLDLIPTFGFSTVRIMGVFQRLGIVYFTVNMVLVLYRRFIPRENVVKYLIITAVVLAIIYTALIHPFGYEMETNLSRRVDLKVLTQDHMYKRQATDPEGIVSTLGALVNGLLGSAVGYLLTDKRTSHKKKLISLLIFMATCLLIGFLLSTFIPINKRLWTTSFIFMTAGIVLAYISFCFFVGDILKIQKPFKFLTYMGANALIIYVLRLFIYDFIWPIQMYSETLGHTANIPVAITFDYLTPVVGTFMESTAFGLLYAAMWAVIATILYKNKIFIKL